VGLVGRPIAFEETLGRHPQKATCMLAVYAFVIDDDFHMCHAWHSASHSEVRLLVPRSPLIRKAISPHPANARAKSRLIQPTSVIKSLTQINRKLAAPCNSLSKAGAEQNQLTAPRASGPGQKVARCERVSRVHH
jgi:hypothetical protein